MEGEDKKFRKEKTSRGERQKISQGDNEKKFQNSCAVSLQNYQSRKEYGTQGSMQIVPPKNKKQKKYLMCLSIMGEVLQNSQSMRMN